MSNEHITSTLCLKNTTTRGRVCDTCRLNPGLIFCEADLAYLCTTCDSHVHAANKLSSNHKRVRVCDVCRQAPRAYICNAEATTLCIACDTVIHSTNSLSHRLPLMPMHQDTEPWSVIGLPKRERTKDNEDEDEAASWLIYDSPAKINVQNQNGVASEFLCNGDEYLELGDYNSFQNTDQFCTDLKFNEDYNYINDGTNTIHHHHHHHHLDQHQQQMHGGCDVDILVPVQSGDVKKYHQPQQRNFQNPKSEYETSINGGYGYFASLSDSVSLSSMEVGSVDLFSSCSSIQTQTQLTAVLEREAKVLRYREKKKTRKFEKTIRYASRKACADTKPRIHGRFAKRTNSDTDIQRDQMFSESLIKEDGYCSVPSF